ncbi:MAG: TlpA family protein disulfide reductase [Gammaproteobacteria bacterium]|nr:TlpA family protein disulfide reductase [Gammaproteobacteria bacterium]
MRPLILILLTLSFSVPAVSPPVESFDRLDAAFPDIVFVNPEGKTSRLSDYKGKVVMVKLWATWCGICRAKWPGHQVLYDSIKNEADVQLITLSVFEDPQVSQDWVDQQGFDVPLFENPIKDRGAVPVADGSYYFIKGTPMTFLIDKNGILRKKSVGTAKSITESDIRGLI